MSSPLVDFHCHLDLYPDFEYVIKEAELAGIYTLAVTTTPRAWERNKQLTDDLHYVRPALGLHPQLVGKNSADELKLWEQLLEQSKYVGEVGLDAGPDFFHTLEKQKEVFEQVLLRCAQAGNKVLSVHAVRTVNTVLDMIEALLPHNRGIVVLHWFTGTPAQARRAIQLGCYFSVNIAMLRGERSKLLLSAVPADRLLTETDGPFIRNGNNPSHPKDVVYAVELLGKLYHLPQEQMRDQIADNFKTLLSE